MSVTIVIWWIVRDKYVKRSGKNKYIITPFFFSIFHSFPLIFLPLLFISQSQSLSKPYNPSLSPPHTAVTSVPFLLIQILSFSLIDLHLLYPIIHQTTSIFFSNFLYLFFIFIIIINFSRFHYLQELFLINLFLVFHTFTVLPLIKKKSRNKLKPHDDESESQFS